MVVSTAGCKPFIHRKIVYLKDIVNVSKTVAETAIVTIND